MTLPGSSAVAQARHDTDAIEWRISDELIGYEAAVAEMEARVAAIRAGAAAELCWLLEHPPLYTAGTSARAGDLLAPDRLPVFKTGRGGQYTYHGPGQRIGYVMLDLQRRGPDLRRYIWRLEEWLIRTIARFGIAGERREGRIGIWVVKPSGAEAKVGAVGVRVRRWVSYHGVAVNLAPDLANFAGIVPCGIKDAGVTSLADLGVRASMSDLDTALVETFAQIFEAWPRP